MKGNISNMRFTTLALLAATAISQEDAHRALHEEGYPYPFKINGVEHQYTYQWAVCCHNFLHAQGSDDNSNAAPGCEHDRLEYYQPYYDTLALDDGYDLFYGNDNRHNNHGRISKSSNILSTNPYYDCLQRNWQCAYGGGLDSNDYEAVCDETNNNCDMSEFDLSDVSKCGTVPDAEAPAPAPEEDVPAPAPEEDVPAPAPEDSGPSELKPKDAGEGEYSGDKAGKYKIGKYELGGKRYTATDFNTDGSGHGDSIITKSVPANDAEGNPIAYGEWEGIRTKTENDQLYCQVKYDIANDPDLNYLFGDWFACSEEDTARRRALDMWLRSGMKMDGKAVRAFFDAIVAEE